MNDKWLDFAIRIQSIAQVGLQYGKDKFDRERYEELRKISAEMISVKTDISTDKIYGLFCNESGIKCQRSIQEPLYLLTGKFFSCMRRTAHGRSPAAGVMLTGRLHPIP